MRNLIQRFSFALSTILLISASVSAPLLNQVLITEASVNYDFELENIANQSADSIFIEVNPENLVLPENGFFSIYLDISLDSEDRNEKLQLSLNNNQIGFTHQHDLTAQFSTGQSITNALYIRNLDLNNAYQDLDFVFRIEIIEGESTEICPMVPKDLALLEYDLTSPDGERQSRISYKFNSEQNIADSTKTGSVQMEVFSYEMDKILTASYFDFVCNKEGVLFSGMEIGQMSFNEGNMILIDVDVDFNNNYIPNILVPGTDLPDAEVRTVGDAEPTSQSSLDLSFTMKMNTKVTNRKVVSFESITVPAGTFDAYRIEYDTDTEFEFISDNLVGMVLRLMKRRLERVSESQSTVWLVKDIGFVKQEVKTREGTTAWNLVNLRR